MLFPLSTSELEFRKRSASRSPPGEREPKKAEAVPRPPEDEPPKEPAAPPKTAKEKAMEVCVHCDSYASFDATQHD